MELLWRLLPAVRRHERSRFLFFASLYALLTLAQTLGLAGSEALFLSRLGAEALPSAFVLASAVAVVGSFAYATVVAQLRNDRLFVYLLVGAGIWLFVAGAQLVASGDEVRAALLVSLFCSFYVTQAVFLTHFRTFATDFFDTLAAKRLFPGFAVGASLGGALGGALAVVLSQVAAPESLIAGWALGLFVTAALLHRGRRLLRRWVPLGRTEADESSVEGLRSAVRFLGRSSLARWLVVSVVGMVLSLSLLHYLSSRIFIAAYPDARDLAGFFGLYLAASNALEIPIALFVTPRIIRRFGVGGANLAHPLLTTATFFAIGARPLLSAAVFARANRELVENALAGEVRNLSYTALPLRFRGPLRAMLEGMVFYAAMSIAGAALLAMGTDAPLGWLAALGIATAGLYGAANWRVRDEYLNGLVGELREGRLDLGRVGAGLGAREVAQLAAQWEKQIDREADPPSRASLELAPLLAHHGLYDSLFIGIERGPMRLSRACLEAMAEFPPASNLSRVSAVLIEALAREDASLRLAATHAAGRLLSRVPGLMTGLRLRLGDDDPDVRAEAAMWLREQGGTLLRDLARGPDAHAAFARLPTELRCEAEARLDDADPTIRAAALRCFARLAGGRALPLSQLETGLTHPDARVRAAAADAAAGQSKAASLLARALDDPVRSVRTGAAAVLAGMGEAGVEAAEDAARATRLWTAGAALSVLADSGTERGRCLLERSFRERVREAWRHRLAIEIAPTGDSRDARFLRTALGDALARSRALAFRSLDLLEDPKVMRAIHAVLRSNAGRGRADALEVISNIGPREESQLLSLLLEEGPLAERLPASAPEIAAPQDLEPMLKEMLHSPDRWLRLAASRSIGSDSSDREESIVERLLALRNVPLFAQLSLDQLEAIGRFMEESHYVPGDVVVREGEPAGELYVLLEGEVRVIKDWGTADERLLNTIPAEGYFGEIALLDGAPRSATIVASRNARTLSLAGDRFRELILQAPEIAFEIFRSLTRRLRAAEKRTAAIETRQ